ncbi:rve domain-containing protein/RVT_3 domain-containing protein [Gossypium australe]|uniref:Rve domain-containing protein/RVT_3 domain-containing protein n=1 Tax=Gossypium australe TaxID=47621 RepID=A0A5B6VLC6_9ROSI|nr:rve domain-containing protein/RVT_3 domain-containing protein [Gossypium australe]
MPPPRTIKEIRRLTGRVVALNRSISKMADKCLPFFKALKTSFSWTKECQTTFEKLKQYLTSPSLLKSPQKGKTFFLYLATSEETVTTILVKSEPCKLQPYFQAHPIVVVTNQPMKEVLSKANTLRRVAKWSIELPEFGVDFAP